MFKMTAVMAEAVGDITRVGQEFSSFEELSNAIKQYKTNSFTNVYIRSSRMLKVGRMRAPNRSFSDKLRYTEIDLACKHGGRKAFSSSKGKRPNQSTYLMDCPFSVTIRPTSDGQKLLVKTVKREHNHENSEEWLRQMPKMRRKVLLTRPTKKILPDLSTESLASEIRMDNWIGSVGPIYMDYNATTPVDPEVIDSIHSALIGAWGNPSSSHSSGVKAAAVIREARNQVALMINGHVDDILFTSGGTEANNMVINSAVLHYHKRNSGKDGKRARSHIPHIITSVIEHDSVLCPIQHLEREGKIEATYISIAKDSGQVSVEDVIDSIRENTVLISLMLANNETGAMQPVAEVVTRVKQLERRLPHRILLHSDAAQAFGKVPVSVADLQVDYMTIVGHKFYGPRIGALYVRSPGENTPLHPAMFGGGQERGFRPGTENTAMIAGLGKAAELVTGNIGQYEAHMTQVRDQLKDKLRLQFGEAVIISTASFLQDEGAPNTWKCVFSRRNRQDIDLGGFVSKVLLACEYSC
ncbi:PREDICTED: selenocysteine lyase-like [Priapulus caudatus]|uniref:Selenocysteine lyase n=1 Tax=Priapulus caudatus TaxID=37621 RepID=A0ABM1EQ59_PRICU|nr:PREDICTED: selenocysteine lyase-like [Priapulus caudatus]